MRVNKTPGGSELADSRKKKTEKAGTDSSPAKSSQSKETVGVSRETDKAGMTGDILTKQGQTDKAGVEKRSLQLGSAKTTIWISSHSNTCKGVKKKKTFGGRQNHC